LAVLLNENEQLDQKVRVEIEDNTTRYCFTASDLEHWGVKTDKLPDPLQVNTLLNQKCIQVQELIPDASFSMDMATMTGVLSIPQAYAGHVKRGYIDPAEWDAGITAGFVSYSATAVQNNNKTGGDSSSLSVGLNSGFNIAGWRLRHNGNLNYSKASGGGYNALNSYAQHDIGSLDAQFTLGEYFTPGDSFDSVPFTGIQLASDDNMLPESERGFAPVVRGIADTNAKVTIRQNGNIIHETTVTPGAFAIDDLYATGYAGDLDVTVTEADGREKRFTVPFASVVQMLRPDSSRFNATLGHYRDDSLNDPLLFGQGTYRRGISNWLTLYGGGMLADGYGSLVTGAAVGTSIGAIALDTSFSRASGLPEEMESDSDSTLNGRSFRVSYSKLVSQTDTNLALAAYRFSSEGYLDLGAYAHLRESDAARNYKERNRIQMSVSQSMGALGNLYISGLSSSYWDERSATTTYQVGYNKGFDWGSVSLSAGREFEESGASTNYLVSVSVPLGSGTHSPTLNTALSYDSDNNSSLRTNLTGTAGEQNEINYGVYGSRTTGATGAHNSYGANLNYRSSKAQLGGSISAGEGFTQYSGSVSGTLLVHSGGVVLSPEQGETMALIEADGAAGAYLANGQGNLLDGDGYALTTGLTPYRNNSIGIDPTGLSADVELQMTLQQVAPRRGAIVKLVYPTVVGKATLLQLAESDEIPFGADVIDDNGKSVALVGQGGIVFFRGEHKGLRVTWGQQSGQSCQLRIDPVEEQPNQLYRQTTAHCVRG
jgi:outer membrane usher protein